MLAQVQRLLTTPEMIARIWKLANGEEGGIDEREVLGLLTDFGGLWTGVVQTRTSHHAPR
jgi:hypothetical protein